eukprot:g6000.t1
MARCLAAHFWDTFDRDYGLVYTRCGGSGRAKQAFLSKDLGAGIIIYSWKVLPLQLSQQVTSVQGHYGLRQDGIWGLSRYGPGNLSVDPVTEEEFFDLRRQVPDWIVCMRLERCPEKSNLREQLVEVCEGSAAVPMTQRMALVTTRRVRVGDELVLQYGGGRICYQEHEFNKRAHLHVPPLYPWLPPERALPAAPHAAHVLKKPVCFCLTGAFPTRGRDEVVALIMCYGGRVMPHVDGSTDYLVAGGRNDTEAKLRRARELRVPVLSEADLLEMIRGRASPAPAPQIPNAAKEE